MAFGQRLLSSRGSICQRCLLTAGILARGPGYIQKRSVGMKYLQKLDDAARAWAERAERIKQGKEQNTFAMLEERGYIKDLAGQQSTVLEMFRVKRVGAYVGIDPTADSLHVGHLLPLMPLFWMYMHGYRTFSLIGGATVKIGDPTDRLKSRDPIKPADLTMYMTKMHYQVKKLWVNVDDVARLYGYKWEWAWKRALVNNNTWWNSLPMLEVLKRVGSAMRIGPMLSRDTVKNKLEKGDGMSFAEFTYPIMQGWDWWHMFSRNGIQLQIGGSDQYGNIVSGIDIVKAARDNETDPAKVIPRDSKLDDPVGFTVPLLTDSSGAKFGKSAGNAIWLDKFKTSVFDFYGYWVRQPDHDVEKLLKLFTFQSLDKIREIMAEHEISPEKRVAQHVLAFEVTRLVHGSKEAKQAQMDHQQMYGRPNQELASSAQYMAEDGHPTTLNNAPRVDMQLPESLIMGKSISKILYAAGLVSSTSEGHRIAVKKGAYIGGMPGHSRARTSEARVMDPGMLTFTPIHLWFPQDTQNYLIDGKLLILRRGKHNVRVIEMVSDEEYKASGQTYPGQPYTGAVRQLQNMLKKLKKKEASAKEVRDFLGIEEQAEEDDDPALIKFPEEKKPQILFWEQKIQQMLEEREAEEREAEEKPKGAEESEKKSE